jgi:hypothetical protein
LKTNLATGNAIDSAGMLARAALDEEQSERALRLAGAAASALGQAGGIY